MTLFYDLETRFGPLLKVDPWGLCIVIQVPKFKPDWEPALADLGYECLFEKLDNHPVVLVPVKKAARLETNVFVLQHNVTAEQSEVADLSTLGWDNDSQLYKRQRLDSKEATRTQTHRKHNEIHWHDKF